MELSEHDKEEIRKIIAFKKNLIYLISSIIL